MIVKSTFVCTIKTDVLPSKRIAMMRVGTRGATRVRLKQKPLIILGTLFDVS
jgi:hypothetical protein